jgi:hypothetical protein
MFVVRLKIVFYIVTLLWLISCGENEAVDCEDFDASTCMGIEPESTDVEILFTQMNDSEKIPFILYLGKYDIFGGEPQVLLQDTAELPVYYVRLPFFRDYSVRAEYTRSSEKVYAIDGARLTKKDKKICDTLCWYIYGDVLDVRLKHVE